MSERKPNRPEAAAESMEPAERIAVVAAACRFPRAETPEAFWENLRAGVDTAERLTEEEMLASGVDPALVADPGWVPVASRLPDPGLFDAHFFDVPPREAELLDPQARLFLEVAWEAMERAGYAVEEQEGWVGVFAGTTGSTYQFHHLLARPEVMRTVGFFPIYLANDRDYFATRVAHKLNLRGPAINVQTACSTSLTALHLACQSLLDYQCHMALVGGVRIWLPQEGGYLHQEGGIVSADGQTRAFDARATGTLFGNGAGAVVLKRLEDALADGDPVEAVILGTGINNDGSGKIGFTAPSIAGQAEAVALALEVAGVDPDTVTYVETHGSGTPLGDPIEVAALTDVFRASTDRRGFCALGSVKTNVGHLESASGVAGLIKTVLALKAREIPPSLHFEEPNPRIDFAASPFFVADRLLPWAAGGAPRRAGVSSFGIGGTNVHAVLEEAPERPPSGPSRRWQPLLLSARTPTALEAATDRLADDLAAHPERPLADVAFTLARGRRTFEHRRLLVADGEDPAAAVRALRERDPRRLLDAAREPGARPVVFLLSGVGDHYVGMGRELYREEPVFRRELDRCAELLAPRLGEDVRGLLYPEGEERTPGGAASGRGAAGPDLAALLGRDGAGRDRRLDRTAVLHPALFAVEYALARLLAAWGVEPDALIGYSLGEYTAACLAGVLSLEDALLLVAERARLVEALPPGAMVAVALPEEELVPRLGEGVALAAVNGPHLTVAAGPDEAVAALETRLDGEGVAHRRLPAGHAFHTPALAAAAGPLAEVARGLELRPPEVPYLSNLTGRWISPEEATDPEYWGRHLVSPVRFGAAVAELWREPERVFVEVGPGQGLGSLVVQHPACPEDPAVLSTLPASHERRGDAETLVGALGRLWLEGARSDRKGFWAGEDRRRVVLPTYPFERRRYWIDAPAARRPEEGAAAPLPEGTAAGAAATGRPETLAGRHPRPNLRNPYAAPGTDLERAVCGVWQRVLGLSEVGVHDDFFDLGGNSLVAPQALLRLQEELDLKLPLDALFAARTPTEMAKLVARARAEGLEAALAEREPVDLAAEVWLPPEVAAPAGRAIGSSSPRAVFLTGATGFVGAYLLDELLRRTGARVCCLVRAGDEAEARRRLADNLARHRLSWPEDRERVVPVPGDLGEPLLGLSEDAFDRLAGEVEAVVHAGAWVNFTYPYEALAPVNVGGTREALRLAARGRAKPFHFVSSIAVFAPGSVTDGEVCLEDSDLPDTEGLFAGYAETKWVAERIVRLAGERGIPFTLHRPGVVAGHSRTGVGNPRDLVWNAFKGSIQLGAAIRGMGRLDVTPVDHVVRALVHLILQEGSLGRAFHYPNPRPMDWDEVFEVVREMGYPLRMLPYPEWKRELLAADRRGEDNALLPFLPLLDDDAESAPFGEAPTEHDEIRPQPYRHDDRNSAAGLAGSGIECPPLEGALLRTYLEYFAEAGFLEPPRPVTAPS